jgi:hypothetical protein
MWFKFMRINPLSVTATILSKWALISKSKFFCSYFKSLVIAILAPSVSFPLPEGRAGTSIFFLRHREIVFYFVHDFPFCLCYYLSRLSLPVVHATHPAHYSFCKDWRGYLAPNYDDRLVNLKDMSPTVMSSLFQTPKSLLWAASVHRGNSWDIFLNKKINSFLYFYYPLTIPPLRSQITQANYPFLGGRGAATQSEPRPPHSWCFYITHNDEPQSVGLL